MLSRLAFLPFKSTTHKHQFRRRDGIYEIKYEDKTCCQSSIRAHANFCNHWKKQKEKKLLNFAEGWKEKEPITYFCRS